MSIVIETKLLKKALALAKKGIAKKSTLPVLKMVRLQVVDGKLEIAATNLDLAIQVKIADVSIDGYWSPICVHPDNLLSAIKAPVARFVELNERDILLSITSDNSRRSIAALTGNEFPNVTFDDFNQVHGFNSVDLSIIKNQIAVAAATDYTQPALTGVLLAPDGSDLTVAATDGFRLHTTIRPGTVTQQHGGIVVPASFWTLAYAAFGNYGDILEAGIRSSDGKPFRYAIWQNIPDYGDLEIAVMAQLVDGKFPDYTPIIPTSYKVSMTADGPALAVALTAGLALRSSKKETPVAVFDFYPEYLDLTCRADSAKDAALRGDIIPARLLDGQDGGGFTVNTAFALDAVRGWAGDVVVEWNSRNEPVVFRTGKIVKIIMPMNLENRR